MTAGTVTTCVLGKPSGQDPAGGTVPTESLSLFRAERVAPDSEDQKRIRTRCFHSVMEMF